VVKVEGPCYRDGVRGKGCFGEKNNGLTRGTRGEKLRKLHIRGGGCQKDIQEGCGLWGKNPKATALLNPS